MKYGKVKWFNISCRHGFVTDHETQKDIFFHESELKPLGLFRVLEGQEVSFEIGIAPNGRECAVNLNVIGGLLRYNR